MGNPLIAVLLVAGAGIGAAVLISNLIGSSGGQTKEQAEALERANQLPDPFADLNRAEPPPVPGNHAGPSNPRARDTSPEDLLDADEWVRGTNNAREAKVLDEAARAAKKSGDESTYVLKGIAAREKFSVALDEVRDWELKIRDQYGDADRKVRLVIKEITAWSKAWRRYRKLATAGG